MNKHFSQKKNDSIYSVFYQMIKRKLFIDDMIALNSCQCYDYIFN